MAHFYLLPAKQLPKTGAVGDAGRHGRQLAGWSFRFTAMGQDQDTAVASLPLENEAVFFDGQNLQAAFLQRRRLLAKGDQLLVKGQPLLVPTAFVPDHAAARPQQRLVGQANLITIIKAGHAGVSELNHGRQPVQRLVAVDHRIQTGHIMAADQVVLLQGDLPGNGG